MPHASVNLTICRAYPSKRRAPSRVHVHQGALKPIERQVAAAQKQQAVRGDNTLPWSCIWDTLTEALTVMTQVASHTCNMLYST